MHSQMLTSRLGAELISYKLDGIEKIHQGQDCIDENGRVYWKRHFPVLFPIVGKLKQNKTIINGRTYEMGQHGFARDMEFEPVTKLDNFHSYVLKSNPSTFVKYPFDFSLYVTYRTDENKLTTMYKVVNEGDNNMTFGIGGHPAFKIEQRDLYSDEYYLELRKECDYFILGQHLKYMGYEYDCYCSDDDVLSYVQQVENAVKKGFITYIAHPDYFMLGRRQFSEVCREAAHRIARISLDYDVPLEINLNGFRYGKKCYQFDNKDNKYEERYAYPFREFWEIVSTYGCQVLYGYDAHSPIAFLEKDREYKAHEIIDGLELRFVENIILR